MTAALHDRHAPERSTDSSANGRLVVGAVRETDARRQRAVVAVDQAAGALSPGTVTGEDERARIVVDRRIRFRRRQVRILIAAGVRRLRELVAQAVVEHQLVADSPVVLPVERIVRIHLLEIADRFRPARIRRAEQERRERVAAAVGQRRRARNRGLQETEAGTDADILLAETVRLLAVEREARLPRVGPQNEGHVVPDRNPRLLRSVVGGSSPRRELRERERAHVDVAIDRIRNTDLALPVLADIWRVRILVECVEAECQVIHDPRPDPIPGGPVKVGVEARGINRVERQGKARRAGIPGLEPVVPAVEEIRQALRIAEGVVDLHAVLLGRFLRRPAGRQKVVRHVAEGAGNQPRTIRDDRRLREREELLRDGTEAGGRNDVAGERIANEPGAVGIGTRGRRIVDGDPPALAVHPIRKITVISGVGTLRVSAFEARRLWKPSKAAKKNVRFFPLYKRPNCTGPPQDPPKLFCRYTPFCASKNPFRSSASLRRKL